MTEGFCYNHACEYKDVRAKQETRKTPFNKTPSASGDTAFRARRHLGRASRATNPI